MWLQSQSFSCPLPIIKSKRIQRVLSREEFHHVWSFSNHCSPDNNHHRRPWTYRIFRPWRPQTWNAKTKPFPAPGFFILEPLALAQLASTRGGNELRIRQTKRNSQQLSARPCQGLTHPDRFLLLSSSLPQHSSDLVPPLSYPSVCAFLASIASPTLG